MAPTCAFCEIIEGRSQGFLVAEDEDTLAFLDIRPLFKGHVLVVPRSHVITLMDMTSAQVGGLFQKVHVLARAVERALGADGIFIASNNGVSQSVAHVHIHVVPRRQKDGLRGFMWPRIRYENDSEAAEIAGLIRGELE